MSVTVDLAPDIVELTPWIAEERVEERPRLREISFRPDAWLPIEDNQLRTMFYADASFDEISEALGRGRAGVADRAYSLGLRRNSRREWTELEDGVLQRDYGKVPTSELALRIGRSCTAVYARAGYLDLTEGNPPEWTGWEDQQLRTGYRDGVPVGQLATLIGRPFSGTLSRASNLGIRHANQPEGWSDEESARALELADTGLLYRDIVAQLAGEGFPRRSSRALGLHIRKLGYGRGWGRPWSREEEDLIRHYYQAGKSLTPLGDKLSRSRSAIRWKVEDLGLQGTFAGCRSGWRTERNWTEEEEEILRREYGKTPNKDLARKLDRKWSACRVRANHLGLKHGWMRAFTEDEDRALLLAWSNGLSMVDVADAMKRDPSVIGKRLKRVHSRTFSDPDRPARGPKTRRKDREKITLAGILALDGERA